MRYLMSLICLLSVCLCGCELFTPNGTVSVQADELKPGIIAPQLRVGVKVRISVSASGEPVMEESVKEVSAFGDIVLPYINTTHCAGMSIDEFQKKLTEEYKKFYVDPLVSVYYVPMSEGGSSPYGSVLVTGSVGTPGVVNIPQTCDLTVMQALQNAGGLGQWADATSVRLTRNLLDGTKQRLLINTETIGTRGDTEQNVILMPGDVLYVPESNW
ncbi:MAG: polysaccharide biosynthesis/export family protein [Kiritimatiellia bacterium]